MTTITYRDGLGRPLTTAEMDANFRSIVDNKVEVVAGKGLSTNDYANSDKSKVTTIGNGAATGALADAYLLARANHTGTQAISTVVNLQTALDAKVPLSQKGAANGVAPLDASGIIPAAYMPSYVDDVLEFANLAAFPTTGETGKIYVAIDNGKIYRWSGTTYVEISPSPGSTDSVPEGATNKYYTDARVNTLVANYGIGGIGVNAFSSYDDTALGGGIYYTASGVGTLPPWGNDHTQLIHKLTGTAGFQIGVQCLASGRPGLGYRSRVSGVWGAWYGLTPATMDLAGLSVATDTQVVSSDTILTGIGKLQGQLLPQRKLVANAPNDVSGLSQLILSIPDGASEVDVHFSGLVQNSAVAIALTIGTSAAFITSGYSATSTGVWTGGSGAATSQQTSDTYMPILHTANSQVITGSIRFRLIDPANNGWIIEGTGVLNSSGTLLQWLVGSGVAINLADKLNRIRLFGSGGGNFTAGKVNFSCR